MKFGVKVMPREAILDTQGRAVEQTLLLQHKQVNNLRVGKYIELEVVAASEAEGRTKINEIAELVLYNPLIEVYEIESL